MRALVLGIGIVLGILLLGSLEEGAEARTGSGLLDRSSDDPRFYGRSFFWVLLLHCKYQKHLKQEQRHLHHHEKQSHWITLLFYPGY